MNLDELSDDDDDEISLSSNLSAEAAENVKAISVENAFMEVNIMRKSLINQILLRPVLPFHEEMLVHLNFRISLHASLITEL